LPQQQTVAVTADKGGGPISSDDTYELGHDAYSCGVAFKDNPYDREKNGDEFESWSRGWCDTQQHDYLR
jgi:hypothetical protein